MITSQEICPLNCVHCGQNRWRLYLVPEESSMHLMIACGNKECYQKQFEEVGGEPGSYLFWRAFDITGQDHGAVIETASKEEVILGGN
jgi:hypothetical protein